MNRDLEALSYEILSWEENAALGDFGEAFCFVGGRTSALASEHRIDLAPIEKLCRTVARELRQGKPSLAIYADHIHDVGGLLGETAKPTFFRQWIGMPNRPRFFRKVCSKAAGGSADTGPDHG